MTTTQTDLASTLVQLSHLVQGVFADVSRQHEITPQQAQLLCHLARGRSRMTDLSRALHLEKSSLSGLVDRIEQRGLVVRVRSDTDRRACYVALTARGERLAVKTHADVTAELATLADRLPAADRKRLATGIAQLLAQRD